MPSIQIPLVKPEIGTNIFVCPAQNCGARCGTHIEFVTHFAEKHAPSMGAAAVRVPPTPPAGGLSTTLLNREGSR